MLRITLLLLIVGPSAAAIAAGPYAVEPPCDIPRLGDVDVLVVGGCGGAVEAACEAARAGASVFLIAPRPHLGTDLCSTLRLWRAKDEQVASELATACFGNGHIATPLRVKAAMDRALLQSGVRFLTGCFPSDVLRGPKGGLAGVVMVNRSGRQAIRAKVIVDATRHAAIARQAGVAFRPFRPGPQQFTRIVVGGTARSGKDLAVQKMPFTYDSVSAKRKIQLPVYEYGLTVEMKDDRIVSFFEAENQARDMTYAAGSEMGSEVLSHRPAATILGRQGPDARPPAEEDGLGPFRPRGIDRLYVLGPYADLSGETALRMLRPLGLMAAGRRVGRAAAKQAATLPVPTGAALPDAEDRETLPAEVRCPPNSDRFDELPTIRVGRRMLPVLARYDVVVVGGGTSGAPAAIGAARNGAKTLVIEYLHELGGVGTVGLIAKYWYGLRRGFTQYVDRHVNPGSDAWNAVAKAEWLRRELRDSGADVWFGVLGCGALVQDGRVSGVVVATPRGRGVVVATAVVDATGNADVAAAAGAATRYSFSPIATMNVQVAGFPPRPIGRSYVNTCYTLVDDTDVLDVWHLMVWKRTAGRSGNTFDVGQLVDSRERRRIVGDYILTVPDILTRRTFPDTISQHYSNFDAAAFPSSPVLLLANAKGPCFKTDLPYRCLLPAGLDGILVVGLATSAQRDATTLIRMQPDLQNQGYAAGVAAAQAARTDGRTRSIDLKAVQKKLVAEHVLDPRVLTDTDSHPMPVEEIRAAVRSVVDEDPQSALHALAVVLADRNRQHSVALMRLRHRDAEAEPHRLAYARIIGNLGDANCGATLARAVDAHQQWDRGVALTSQRKTGNTFTDLDRLVIALGGSRAAAARGPLLRKLAQLKPGSELSHYMAIFLAFSHRSSCPEAVAALRALLDSPGFTGHATPNPILPDPPPPDRAPIALPERLITTAADERANEANLNLALKELIVASMLYNWGNSDGRAEAILRQYANDVHGHLASYARRALRVYPSKVPTRQGTPPPTEPRS